MRFAILITVCILSLIGCSPTATVIPGAKNGGSMFALPDNKGYVEVRIESGQGLGQRGKPEPRTMIAYFYGVDGATVMSPAPTDVTFQLGKDSPIPLAPRESDGSFASKPTDFPGGFRGILAAKLAGAPIEASVAVR